MGQFDYASAVDTFATVVAEEPDWVTGRINYAVALKNRQGDGDAALALEELATVLSAEPENARANYVAGVLRLYLGEFEAAASHLEIALVADPQDAYAHYYLAQCRLRAGDLDSAVTGFRTALELDPYLRSAYYSAAQSLQRLDRADEAADYLQSFQRFANNPSAKLAEFKYTKMGPKSLAQVAGANSVPSAVPRPRGSIFTPVESVGALSAEASFYALSTVDIDGDGTQDIVAFDDARSRVLVDRGGTLSAIDTGVPWAESTAISAFAWGDLDNDGNVDLYLCRKGPNELWYQRAPGEWQKAGLATNAHGGDSDCADVALVDADHDGDLDILLGNRGAADNLLNNNLDGSFRSLASQLNLPQGDSRYVLSADLDADLDVDLLVLRDEPPHSVLINDRQWRYQPARGLDDFLGADLLAAVAVDLDADASSELVALDREGAVRLWRREISGAWTASTLLTSGLRGDVQLTASDVTGDGRMELLLLGAGAYEVIGVSSAWEAETLVEERYDGGVAIPVLRSLTRGPSLLAQGTAGLLEWAPGPGRFDFAAVTLTGKQDDAETMRTNASGIGTIVSLRNGDRWTRTNTYKHSSLPGQSSQPLALGLAGRSGAEFLALDWPDGVYQTELGVGAGPLRRISEVERQMGSCPVLFAWNGERFDFVTDILGVGALGFFVEPGVTAPPRPFERLSFRPGALAPRDGRLAFKLSEPMEENAYIDAMALESYDLPPEWQFALDERFATGAPAVTGEPIFYRRSIGPRAARDSSGTDVLELVSERDYRAMDPGRTDSRFIGLLEEPESVVLEFGTEINAAGDKPVLLVDGWIEYPYSQTAFAAWQAGEAYEPTTLEARDGDGNWHLVYPGFGFPGGMPREMSLPLNALPPGADAVRLSWNRETYWDRVRIVYAEEPPASMRMSRVEASHARVAKTGFQRRIMHAQRRQEYVYDQRTTFRDTRYPTGFYTATGEMTRLLAEADDALAIIGPGEEVHVEFEAPPPPAPGLRRWYVLETHGWGKDNDLYTQDGETVGPLPRAHRDADAEAREALHQRYNVRFQSGL